MRKFSRARCGIVANGSRRRYQGYAVQTVSLLDALCNVTTCDDYQRHLYPDGMPWIGMCAAACGLNSGREPSTVQPAANFNISSTSLLATICSRARTGSRPAGVAMFASFETMHQAGLITGKCDD